MHMNKDERGPKDFESYTLPLIQTFIKDELSILTSTIQRLKIPATPDQIMNLAKARVLNAIVQTAYCQDISNSQVVEQLCPEGSDTYSPDEVSDEYLSVSIQAVMQEDIYRKGNRNGNDAVITQMQYDG